MNTSIAKRNGQHIVDEDAVEIGSLYERSKTSIVESVELLRACGKMLAKKKASLPHGGWLPWLSSNEKELGFSSRRTASMLIKAANGKLTSHLDVPSALLESRKIWGNDKKRTRNNYQSSVSLDHDEDEDDTNIVDEIEDEDPQNFVTAYLIRADNAKQFARDSEKLTKRIIENGQMSKEIVAAARAVAYLWDKLADKLEESL